MALHVCLGLPSYSHNLAMLIEANDSPQKLVAEEHSLRLSERMNRSDPPLITRLLQRPPPHVKRLTAIFQGQIGTPEDMPEPD